MYIAYIQYDSPLLLTVRGMSIRILKLKIIARLIFIVPEIERFWDKKYHVLNVTRCIV